MRQTTATFMTLLTMPGCHAKQTDHSEKRVPAATRPAAEAGEAETPAPKRPAVADYSSAKDLELMMGFPPPVGKRVDRTNALFKAPFNRWSYLNMRKVFPTAGIATAQQAVAIPRAIDSAIDELEVTQPKSGKPVSFATYLEETYSDSLVIVKGGTIVYEKYLNGMHADHPHQMMSVTKSFAGLLGLMAVDEGELKESDAIEKHVPEIGASPAFKGATFGQVLDMTNSLSFSEDYADPESGIQNYAVVLGLMAPQPDRKYAASIYDYLVTLPNDPSHPHGDVFHYQTPKTDVVNWVTNRATQRSFQDELYGKLWSKLGTDGETYVLLDKNGTLFAGGGLNATPNDLARFTVMMLNDGKFNGQPVVSPMVIQKLAKGGNIDAFSNGPSSSGFMGNKDWSYRAQFWVRHTPGKEAFMALGIHGQFIYLDVIRNVGIVKQSSLPVSVANEFDVYNFGAFDAIIAHLSQ